MLEPLNSDFTISASPVPYRLHLWYAVPARAFYHMYLDQHRYLVTPLHG